MIELDTYSWIAYVSNYWFAYKFSNAISYSYTQFAVANGKNEMK